MLGVRIFRTTEVRAGWQQDWRDAGRVKQAGIPAAMQSTAGPAAGPAGVAADLVERVADLSARHLVEGAEHGNEIARAADAGVSIAVLTQPANTTTQV